MQNEFEKIQFHQLPVGSIFKIGFLCNIFFWVPLGLIAGIQALFGGDSVSFGGVPTYGFGGLFGSMIMSVIFSAVGGGILALGGLIVAWATQQAKFGELLIRLSSKQMRRNALVEEVLQQRAAAKEQEKGSNQPGKQAAPDGRLW